MRISPKALRWIALAARFLPRLARVRRRTWVGIAVALAILLAILFLLFVWAAVAVLTWLWSHASGGLG